MKDKQLTDKNGKTIHKGSIVKFTNNGVSVWKQVRSVNMSKKTVNLEPVHGGRSGFPPQFKNVPLAEVYEDGDAQWDEFSKSETYMCM